MAQGMKYLPSMPVDLSLVPKNLCKKAGHNDTWLDPSMALPSPLDVLFPRMEHTGVHTAYPDFLLA